MSKNKSGGLLVRNRTSTRTGRVYHKDLEIFSTKVLVYWDDGSRTLASQKTIFPIGYFD